MKIRLRHLFLTAFLLLAALPAPGQGKVYTRKVRLGDFPTRTIKVVLAGNPFLELTLREAVAIHWRISPYEFCTPEEYAGLKDSNALYFLLPGREDGLDWLILAKGGRPDEKESLRKPFEVVRLPIASADEPSGRELVLMGAFLDIIQNFVEEAMISDRTAYGGLSESTGGRLRGKKVLLDPDAADAAVLAQEADALAGVVIAPGDPEAGNSCYKMLISADTHELLFFEKCRYRTPDDARFTEGDVRRFERHEATVVL